MLYFFLYILTCGHRLTNYMYLDMTVVLNVDVRIKGHFGAAILEHFIVLQWDSGAVH